MTKQIMIKSGEFGEFTKAINVVVQEEWYSIEQCRANPRSIYIFFIIFCNWNNISL